MTRTPDLFDASVLPGPAATGDFVTGTEEQALIAAIGAADPRSVPLPGVDWRAADGLLRLVL